MSRRFELHGDAGVIAEGVEFTNGRVVVNWPGYAVGTWPSIGDATAGLAGIESSAIVWVDHPEQPVGTCKQPPFGWECSREAGHSGPCAARARREL